METEAESSPQATAKRADEEFKCRYKPQRGRNIGYYVTLISAIIVAIGGIAAAIIGGQVIFEVRVLSNDLAVTERRVDRSPSVAVIDFARKIQSRTERAMTETNGGITCAERPQGTGRVVTWTDQREHYPPGAYNVSENKDAVMLAALVAETVHRFNALRESAPVSVSLTGRVLGTADKVRMSTPVIYNGPAVKCEISGPSSRTLDLVPGSTRIDNSSLGCARAASFVGLTQTLGADPFPLQIGGHEYTTGSERGDLRLVNATMEFHNIGAYYEKVLFCP